MSKHRALFDGLNSIVRGKRSGVAWLVYVDLIRFRSAITVAQSESKGMVSDAICYMHDCFPVEPSSDVLRPSACVSSDHA